MIQSELLPQAILTLTQRVHPAADCRHMLADGQVDALHEGGVDLPAIWSQYVMDGLQRAKHHAMAHPYQSPSTHGLVDMVLTDPPYLVRYRSRDGRPVLNDDTDAWLVPAFAELYRVLRRDRFCVSFCGFTQAERFLAVWKAAGFRVLEHLVWRKRYPSSTGFVRRYHEQAYLLAKGTPRRPPVLLPSVLEWRYTGNTLHPTQKPVGALLPLVLAFSQVGDVVLDPFAGSGSTAVAAALLGRHYIAIELSEEYARIAQDRLRSGAYRTM